MSFQEINTATPAGTDKKKFGDDVIREFKEQTVANFQEVSNYPASAKPALRTAVWTTATRPSGAELVDRVTGYNTDLDYEEYYDLASTSWIKKSITQNDSAVIPQWTVATRPTDVPVGYSGNNTDLAIIERWDGSAWVRLSGDPAGKVGIFAMTTPPVGWLKCNGQAVSRSTYSDLYAAIGTIFGTGDGSTTFNLPELRGEFVRGWDDTRGVDSGRGFGNSQGDAIRNITGSVNLSIIATATANGALAISTPGTDNYGNTSSGNQKKSFSFDASRVVPTAAENRPRNIALSYFIKS